MQSSINILQCQFLSINSANIVLNLLHIVATPLLVHVLKRQHPIIFEKLKCQCSEIHYPWTESKRRKKIGLLGVY